MCCGEKAASGETAFFVSQKFVRWSAGFHASERLFAQVNPQLRNLGLESRGRKLSVTSFGTVEPGLSFECEIAFMRLSGVTSRPLSASRTEKSPRDSNSNKLARSVCRVPPAYCPSHPRECATALPDTVPASIQTPPPSDQKV